MRRYLFLYLKTGSGHLAPAKAVANKIRSKKKSDIEIELTDGLEDSGIIIRKILENGYRKSVQKAVWVFEFLYFIHKIPEVSKITSGLVSYIIRPGIERQILRNHPEKIVLFHFFLIKPVFSILRDHQLNIPVITVVTDPFTAHPIWFLYKNQNYIVFSNILKDKCIEMGIDRNNIKVFPFVLDNKFSTRTSRSGPFAIRQKLGFRPDSRIVLIIGGGDGMPKGKKILRQILKRNLDAEIAIVCGNDFRLYHTALKLIQKHKISNLKVYGYIDYVDLLISISDIVLTKCGASTFMEILIMGKVPVISNYIWEQEKGNADYICSNRMGILEKNTRQLPSILDRLLRDDQYYNSIRENILNASLINGTSAVSDYILNFHL